MAASDDRNCVIMYSRYIDRVILTGEIPNTDSYMYRINSELLYAEDVFAKTSRNEYLPTLGALDPSGRLTVITGKDVRDSFHADKICYYTTQAFEGSFRTNHGDKLPFEPDESCHIVRVFFLKEGGFHYDVLLLMKEEAYKHRGKYIEDLFGTIIFNDEEVNKVWERPKVQ